MMRWLMLLLACSVVTLGSEAQRLTDQRLEVVFREYLEAMLGARPLTATQLGDHRYDDRLDNVSVEARRRYADSIRRTLVELPAKVDFDALSRDAKVDYRVFERALRRAIWLDEKTDPWAEDPRVYNALVTEGVYLLLTQSSLPMETNLANAMARMRQIPSVLNTARKALGRPPRAHTETAINQNRGAITFYDSGLGELVGETAQREAILAQGKEVAKWLREYQRFLENELLPRADGEWRLGDELFGQKLALTLDAGLSASEVLAEAQAEYARVRGEMAVFARQLWAYYFRDRPLPPDDEIGRELMTRAVLEAINQEHGEAEHLTRDVKEIVGELKAFIAERDILTLPDPDQCGVIEMPEFQRGNSTAYLNPAPPLDPTGGSFYAVSPPPSNWSTERSQSFLEEYNRHMLHILSIHEAYPGHYVQLEYANRHPSWIRRVIGSGPFAEGWAVYTEQMMLDQGYGDGDLRLRLMQLKFYLRAVINAILDHRMHCDEMTDEAAMELLVRGGFQSEGEAALKVIRAKQSSCQLSTYFVGRMAFYRLRQEMQRELGDRFVLGRFHEAVLAHGSIPPSFLTELVRDELTSGDGD